MKILKSGKHQPTLLYGKQTLNGKPYNHKGIDYVKRTNSLDYIVACEKGKVLACRNSIKGYLVGSYGNYVILEHANGIKSLYAHMKYGTVKVKVGQTVEKGAILGYMGKTGYSNGAHLHFEIRKNNVQVNPLDYMIDKIKIYPYGYKEPVKKKSVTAIAKEVLAGKWGNGTTRKAKLTKAGYNYSQVQKIVNKLIK